MEMEKNGSRSHHQKCGKISSLLILRAQDKMYRMRMRKQGRMVKRRKYLKQHIQENTNIFQMLASKFNRKSAQNILWQKNYKLKMAINILREENSSVKAKLWNIEKENRRMDKQIEAWNLQKIFSLSKNKPYIDMLTVSKVFADQDYEIVSTKIDIANFQRVLHQKQDEIQRLSYKTQQLDKHVGHISHLLTQAKCSFLTSLYKEALWDAEACGFDQHLEATSTCFNLKVASQAESVLYIKKSMDLKRKINADYKAELEALDKEINGFKRVDQDQIDKLKQKMRRIKLEEQNNIKDFKKDVKTLKRNTTNFECQIQQQMDGFIRTKILLSQEITVLLATINNQLGSTHHFQTQILPEISRLTDL